jgi:hypothetical protein
VTGDERPDHVDTAEARRLANAATPGPWRVSMSGVSIKSWDDVRPVVGSIFCDGKIAGSKRTHDDAEFIAASRALVPALADEVERLRAERDQLLSEARQMECHLSAAVAKVDGMDIALGIAIKRGNDFGDGLIAVAAERDEAIRLLRRKTRCADEGCNCDAALFLAAHPEPTP